MRTGVKRVITATPNPDTGTYDLRVEGNYMGCIAGPMTLGTTIPTGPTETKKGNPRGPFTEAEVKTKLKSMFPGAQIVVQGPKQKRHPALKGINRGRAEGEAE